jgi:hypothetical protein
MACRECIHINMRPLFQCQFFEIRFLGKPRQCKSKTAIEKELQGNDREESGDHLDWRGFWFIWWAVGDSNSRPTD